MPGRSIRNAARLEERSGLRSIAVPVLHELHDHRKDADEDDAQHHQFEVLLHHLARADEVAGREHRADPQRSAEDVERQEFLLESFCWVARPLGWSDPARGTG